MSLEELKSDIASHAERLAGTDFSRLSKDQLAKAVQVELGENILPLFQALVESLQAKADETDEAIDDLAGAMDELIDQSGDVLHPETTAKIVGLFEVGKMIATELEALLAASTDETKKRRLGMLIAGYRQSVELVTEIVAAATLEFDDEGGDEDEDEETDDETEPATTETDKEEAQ